MDNSWLLNSSVILPTRSFADAQGPCDAPKILIIALEKRLSIAE